MDNKIKSYKSLESELLPLKKRLRTDESQSQIYKTTSNEQLTLASYLEHGHDQVLQQSSTTEQTTSDELKSNITLNPNPQLVQRATEIQETLRKQANVSNIMLPTPSPSKENTTSSLNFILVEKNIQGKPDKYQQTICDNSRPSENVVTETCQENIECDLTVCPFKITSKSVGGCRGHANEDRMITGDLIPGKNGVANSWLFAVFDGHGGNSAANYCKENLARVISNEEGFFSADFNIVNIAINNGFVSLQREMAVHSAQWPYNQRYNIACTAGTTVSLVLIRGSFALCHWCGDSPIFLINTKGQQLGITNVAVPHNLDNPNEVKRIIKIGGRVDLSKKRVCARLNLHGKGDKWYPLLSMTRALGNFWSFIPSAKAYAVEPRSSYKKVNILDPSKLEKRYIIIASDGLTEYCSQPELGKIFIASPFPMEIADAMVQYAVNSAVKRGAGKSHDDITCIVIEI